MKAHGTVFKYGDNVDTDVIIPARYLNSSDPKELAAHCMEDIDKDFVNKVKTGDLIVADKNFGCGSSREHAPIAIKAAGVSCVIAETFARIFYRNAINIGLPIIECPEAAKGIEAGDEIEVETTATSSSPYVKSLSATYHIGIETSNFTYDIEDAVGDKFFTLNLTNTVSYYQVERAFGSYQEKDRITIDEYRNLTDAEKENCFSAKVTLNFTPRDIFLDMTNTNYLHRIPNSEKTEVINNFNYVNEFSFKMDASSSAKVMFYKDDPSQDYTYPIINDTSIINVTVETAE